MPPERKISSYLGSIHQNLRLYLKPNSTKNAFVPCQKSLAAAHYLKALFDDAVAYQPLEVKEVVGKYQLEVVKDQLVPFTVAIAVLNGNVSLKVSCPAGITPLVFADIRYFVEDLACYLNAAYDWK